MKKRLADARYRGGEGGRKDRRFLYGTNSIDKFKDIPVATTLHLYAEYILIETNHSMNTAGTTSSATMNHAAADAILPLSDPSVQEVLDWLEDGKLHPILVPMIGEHYLAIYYDGSILIDLFDYRAPLAVTSHKILLKPNEATLHQDICLLVEEQLVGGNQVSGDDMYFQIEEKLRLALHPNLLLDPNPKIGELMRTVHLQNPSSMRRPFRQDALLRAGAFARKYCGFSKQQLSQPSSQTSSLVPTGGQQVFPGSMRLLQTLQELKNSKKLLEAEPFHGLDTKKGIFIFCSTVYSIRIFILRCTESKSSNRRPP